MKYWYESLIENGFDVATLVYIAILTIIYHYLLRWYISIKFNKINKELSKIKKTVETILYSRKYYE
tara:strand:- start:52 stop:249 length:198 start_codon:yes stop_codon:yes gene_type:complete